MDDANELFSRVLSERQAREEAQTAQDAVDAEREEQRRVEAVEADELARVASELSNERAAQFIDAMLQNAERVPLVELHPAGYRHPNYWIDDEAFGVGWVLRALRRGYSSAKGPSASTVPGIALSPTGAAYSIVQGANDERYLGVDPPAEIGIDASGPLADPFASDAGLQLLTEFIVNHEITIGEDPRPRSEQVEARIARVAKWQQFEAELRRQGLQRKAQKNLRDSQAIHRFIDARDSLMRRGRSLQQAILEAAGEYDLIVSSPLSDFGSDAVAPAFPPLCRTRVLASGEWSGDGPPATGGENRELVAMQAFAAARDTFRGGNARFEHATALHTAVSAYVKSIQQTEFLGEQSPDSIFSD